MSLIKAVIIDDEAKNRALLEMMLAEYCPSVKLVAMAENVNEGLRLVKWHKPDLVFLDVRMPRKDEGFDFFEHIGTQAHELAVVFVTAYDEHIRRAFNKTNAIGYLLKPVDPEELLQVVFKTRQMVLNRRKNEVKVDDTMLLSEVLYLYIKDDTIRIKMTDGRERIAQGDTLEHYESLPNCHRANRQYILNMLFVNKLSDVDAHGERTRGAMALLYSGEQITISVSRKQVFFKAFEQLNT
jgi:DNA-binding LytR/AlgR family response regulator